MTQEVVLLVGTKKGTAVLRSSEGRMRWSSKFVLPGWIVTASARDGQGRYLAAVASESYGAVIFVSEDLEEWRQLEGAPRYAPGDRGNPEHNRIAASTDFEGRYSDGGRFVDQIWTLHVAGERIYAGVSEAGLFVSDNACHSWQPVRGFNEQRDRERWVPGFGGLAAHTILSDANNPRRMWAGVSAAGFFRTDDGGITWQRKDAGVPADTGQCVHCVTHDPRAANRLFRQEHRGVYRSDDGGDSWSVFEEGLPITELSDGHRCSFGFPIAMDRSSGAAFVAPLDGDNFRFPRDGRLAVYRRMPGDVQWQAMREGLPDNSYTSVLRGAMAADQGDPGGIYVGTASGALYGSTDLGESWRCLAQGLPRIQSVEAYTQ